MRLAQDQMAAWGRRVGAEVEPPVFIGLEGPLGAGKSVFARAVAEGAGVVGVVPSPTFNVLFRYPLPGGGALVHADLYRIADAEELAWIGWEDVLAERAIVLVEWARRASGELPDDRWEIELALADDPRLRTAGVRRYGKPSELPGFPAVVT